jgi:methionyl-tRNA synthetase
VSGSDSADRISLSEFRRLDLRVGEIARAEPVDGADRLLRLEIDLGREQRTVVAGLAPHHSPTSLLRAKVVVVANIEPARILGITSEAASA